MDFLSTPLPTSTGTEETVEKRRVSWNTGRKRSDEFKAKLSQSIRNSKAYYEGVANRKMTEKYYKGVANRKMSEKYYEGVANRKMPGRKYVFEELSCSNWLDANKDLVDRLTYSRGKKYDRSKVIELMQSLCPTATEKYLVAELRKWSKKTGRKWSKKTG